MEGLKEISDFIAIPRQICLLSHRNPDGDALGSSLALSNLLRSKGHNTRVIFPSDFPPIFHFLEGTADVIIGDEEPEMAIKWIEQSELIFLLDFNSLERIDKLGLEVQTSTALKVLIDHHIDPEPCADYYLSNTDASSTCELIYEFIDLLGLKNDITIPIAENLYVGIITDTGSFKYNTSVRAYQIAGDLKQIGIDDYQIQDFIFNSLSEKQLLLLGHCLKSRMEIIPEYHAGIIVLNKFDFANFNIQRGDTEGIVNYLLMIRNVKLAVFITQQPSIIKISLRSKGDISVQQMARDHFNGGGHKNASGGYFHGSLRPVIEKIKEVLPQYVKPD